MKIKNQVLCSTIDLRLLTGIAKDLSLSLDVLVERLLRLEAIELPVNIKSLEKHKRRIEHEEKFDNLSFVMYYSRGKVLLEGLAWND